MGFVVWVSPGVYGFFENIGYYLEAWISILYTRVVLRFKRCHKCSGMIS